jgi:hypothetical protein
MLEAVFEFLANFVLQVIGQIVFEIAAEFGRQSVRQSIRTERSANPVLAGIGHLLLGGVAGGLSLLIFGSRLTDYRLFPGVSLLASPLCTGLAMYWLGELWRDRGHDLPTLFTFRAVALFAFGMALVRFLYIQNR